MRNEEWALIAPHLPFPNADASGGLQRGKDMFHPMRLIVDAVSYVLRICITWRALPHDFHT
jgi:transposase